MQDLERLKATLFCFCMKTEFRECIKNLPSLSRLVEFALSIVLQNYGSRKKKEIFKLQRRPEFRTVWLSDTSNAPMNSYSYAATTMTRFVQINALDARNRRFGSSQCTPIYPQHVLWKIKINN